jgi:hypothetical protein
MKPSRNGTQQKAQLSSRQTRALWLYAQGSTDAEVANELGVERSTAWRWRTVDLAFRRELRRTNAVATKAAAVRLEGLVDRALDVLKSVLDDDAAPVAVRLRAAEAVLQRAGIQSSDGERTAVTSSIGDLLDD